MNIRVEKLPKSRVKLTVELPPDEVQPFLETAACELTKEQPVKGFRPGSAPLAVVRSAFGDEGLVKKTLERLVPKTYVQCLLDHDDIEAIGRPEVEAKRVTIGEPWVYEASVAVLPPVTLGSYRDLRGEKRAQEVTRAEVERELETLQKMRASYITVPRPAAKGDRVEADITATVDRVPLEHGTARRQPILLGESHLVPGFEEQLAGVREGGTKEFSVTFPAGHHQQHLRGRSVDFRVHVHAVQQRVLPELNDTFAHGVGKFSSLGELREQLTANLKQEKEMKETQRFQMVLLQQVIERATFGEVPDILLEGEVDKMLAELSDGLGASDVPLEQYLQQIGKSLSEVRTGLRSQALDRIRAGLTLRAIARTENVEVHEEEVDEEVNKVLQQFPSVEEAGKHVDLEELTGVARGTVRNRKVFARLEAFASGA